MEIRRDALLKRLIDLRHNGMIKVITGMRRSGKSYHIIESRKQYLLKYTF